MAKYRIKGLPNNMFQEGGTNSKKDKWGRSSDSEWYGFDPKTKEWTLGKRTVKKEVTVKPKKGSQTTADLKKYGKRDQWGRTPSDKWYGFDPKTKKWTLGEPAWKKNETSTKVNEFVNQNILNPVNWLMGEDPIESLYAPAKQPSKQSKGKAYLNPYTGEKVYGNGPWNNYGDGPVQMEYPEKYAMGPRSAGEFVASLPSRALRGLNAVNRAGLNDIIPGAVTRGMTLGEQAALKSRLAPFTIGNVLTAESIARTGTEYIPNILQGKDVTQNYLETIAALVPVSNLGKVKRVNDARNVYNLGKYGSKNFADPLNAKDQYKFYKALGTLTGHRDGGSIPKAQFGAQTNPLYSGSNNLLIKAANKKAPKSLAKDVRPTIKKQIADNEIAIRKKAEADYIKAVATGQVSALNKPAADAALANAELEREQARLQQQYYDDIYEQEEQKFQDKPLGKWTQYGLPILDLFDTSTKTGQFVRDLTADPLNVVEEGIWDQDYLPNRSAILRDPSHPLYAYYMKRSGMDESPLSQTLQYVNPFSSAAEATVAIRKGDYAEALKQYGEGLGKSAGIAVAMEALPAVMGTTVALPEAIGAATGLTGTTTVGGVLGAGFAGYGLTKLPTTAKKIATAIETGNKEDWREAVNETGLNLLDFIGTGEFFESTRPFAGALSAEEGTAALLNRAGELAKEEKLLGELKPEIGQVFDRDYYREQMGQLDQENPFDWSTIDEADDAFGSQQLYDDLASIESDMQNLDMRIDDLFINEQYYEPEVFKRLLNEAQEERQVLSETYDQLASYKNAVRDAEETGASGSRAFDDREYLNSQLGQDQELDQMISAYNNYDDQITALKEELNFGIDPSDINAATELETQIDALITERDSMRQSATSRMIDLNTNTRPDFVPKPAPTIIPQTPAADAAIDLRRSLRSAQSSPGAVNTPNAASSFDLNRITTPAVTTPAVTPTVDRAAELAERANTVNGLFNVNATRSGSNPNALVTYGSTERIKPFKFSEETLNQIDDSLYIRMNRAENPSQMIHNLNDRFTRNRLTQEAYDELVDGLFHSLEQQGRSKEYMTDIKNVRRLINEDSDLLRNGYTGSNRNLSDLQDWYKNMDDAELDQIDFIHQYGADDIDALYRSLDTDVARETLLNQVYDDYRYTLRGERNPNNRPFNLRTQEIHSELFQPSEFSSAGLNIPTEDIELLKEVTQLGGTMFTGQVSYADVSARVEKLKSLSSIQKTENLQPLIEKYEKLYNLLPDGAPKYKVMAFVEDLKSTKWLRTEYAEELKAAGLSPKEIEGASIMTYHGNGNPGYATKMLVTQDGRVVGTLNVSARKIQMPDGSVKDVMDIGSTGVNYEFHPYSVGKGHSKFKTWTEAEEYMLKESLSPEYQDLAGDIVKAKSKKDLLDLEDAIYEKRLNTFPEEVRDKSFIKARARDEVSDVMKKINESKEKVKIKKEQLESNNNNRWGEALYRASHHGLKDTRGPVVTHEHFVVTGLPDPITGEIIARRRAYDYWYSQMKQMNEKGVPKAQHLFPGGAGQGNYIMVMRKRGGNIPKLSKFIR